MIDSSKVRTVSLFGERSVCEPVFQGIEGFQVEKVHANLVFGGMRKMAF